MKNLCARILVVEDDPDQRYLIELAFRAAIHEAGTVYGVGSGNDAIRYLCGEGGYSDRKTYPFPSLIITDLKMADGDGFAVLDFLRQNPGWSIVPRVVISASDDDDDIKTAYLLGATAYHQKPMGVEELKVCAERIVGYWTSCHVPPVDEKGRLVETLHRGKIGERFQPPPGGVFMRRPGAENLKR